MHVLRRALGYATVLLALTMCAAAPSPTAAQSDAARRAKIGGLLLDDNYAEAETLANQWLADAESSGSETLGVADALEQLIKIYAGLKRFDDAEAVWRRCLDIRVKNVGEKHALVTQTLDVMAGIYLEQGKKDKAQALWREGLAAYRRQALPPALAGKSYAPDGSHQEVPTLLAQGRTAEAEDALRRKGDQAGLAVFLLDRGRTKEAVEAHRRLLDSAPTADRARNTAALYRQRHLSAYEQEFLERALILQEKTLGPDNPNLIATLTDLAASYERSGNLTKAYGAAKRASSVGGVFRARQTFTTPASAALQMRKPHLDFLRIAVLLQKEQPNQAATFAGETFEASQLATETVLNATLSQMGLRFSKGKGRLPDLIRRRQDLERDWSDFDRQLLAAITGAAPQAERDRLRAGAQSVNQDLAAVDAELRASFPQYFELAVPSPLSAAAVQSMLRDDEALLQFAVSGEQAFAWAITRTNLRWSLIPKNPSEIAAMVATLRCGLDYEGSWGALAPASAKARCHDLLKRNYAEADIRVPRPLPFDLATAHQLYAALLAPFEDLIAGKELLLVPSGPLSSLPLHVLVTRPPQAAFPSDWSGYAAAHWLTQSFASSTLPSVASLKALRQQAGRSNAARPYIAFANPVLSGPDGKDNRAAKRQSCDAAKQQLRSASRAASIGGRMQAYMRGGLAVSEKLRLLSPLVETADEVCAVAQELGASPQEVFLAANATEHTLKAASEAGSLANYRVIHFATHGLLASETELAAGGPAEPALVLTPPDRVSPEDDGLLTSGEILQLRLNADWVILSACNTAGGDSTGADALSGLARAFFYAGSRALLVSHWAVDSAATVELITGSFAALQDAPTANRAEAVRHAMLRMIGEGQEGAHPAYWAPFVVVGEGSGGT